MERKHATVAGAVVFRRRAASDVIGMANALGARRAFRSIRTLEPLRSRAAAAGWSACGLPGPRDSLRRSRAAASLGLGVGCDRRTREGRGERGWCRRRLRWR